MINRQIQPKINEIKKIEFVAPEKRKLNEHVSFYHMKNVPNETVRLELYFDAGKCRGAKGIPSFVNGLLLSGTDQKSSIEIHNEINQLGGFYESAVAMENAVVTIYCLKEHLNSIASTLIDAIQNTAFIQSEVNELLSDRKQRFAINLEKVSYNTQRLFQQNLFASHSNYGSVLQQEDFDNVSGEELIEFHSKHYKKGLSRVVLVGNVDDDSVAQIEKLCAPLCSSNLQNFVDDLVQNKGVFHQEKNGAIQSAIRVGRILFNKQHEDYLDFLVLHTILGDYFGSRLMSNIREDKGYTYGIGTMISELDSTGFFLTATEVNSDVRENTLKEIRYEFERLQTELVDNDELALVKNYMLGQLLKSADGPYAMMDLYLSAVIHNQDLEFYNKAIEAINNINPQRIQELAKKYLKWEDMTVVSCG